MRRILIYVVFALVGVHQARADATTVLVFPFENASNDRTLDWIGEGVSELMIERLQPESGAYMFTRDERLAAFEKLGIPETTVVTRATALKLGWEMGADHIVTGRFSGDSENFQLSARLIDMGTGSAVEISTQGKLDEIIPLSTSLAWQVLTNIVPGAASGEADYTARPPIPRSAFESYVRGILNQDLRKRIELLETAVRLDPQYESAFLQLGRAYYLQHDFKGSNVWLQKMPSSFLRPQVQFLMGLKYFYLSDYTRSATAFQTITPTYEVLLNRGGAFFQKGDNLSAVMAWQQAAEMDPMASDAYFNIGYASFRKGDFDTAVKNLNESLKIRGRDSEALFLLGRSYERLGRIEESQRATSQAARLSQRVERWLNRPIPDLLRLAMSMPSRTHRETWTETRLARRAAGENLLQWLESIQSEIDVYLFGDALRDLQDVIRVFPESSEARSLLDEVHRRQNVR